MDWIAGILTLMGMWMVGEKNRWGFMVLFLNEFVWLYVILTREEIMGFLPLCFALIYINIKAFIDWGKDAKTNTKES